MVGYGSSNDCGRLGVGGRGLDRGRVFLLSLVWLWLFRWSPILAHSSDNSSVIKEQQNGNETHDGNNIMVNINENKDINVNLNGAGLLSHEVEDRRLEQENQIPQEPSYHDSIEKITEDKRKEGVSEYAELLAGPSPHEHLLYSDHSCTCHPSPLSPFIEDSFSSSATTFGDTCSKNSKSENSGIGNDDACLGRIFYLVSIHSNRTLSDALYLFRAIRDSRNIVLVHIDAKFGLEPYYDSPLHKEIEACPCGTRVEVASIHDCKWGSWSMNLPTLWSMEKAVDEYAGKWDVFINLSGDTLPVYSQDRIAQLFGGPLRGINFVTSVACETGLVPTYILDFPKKWHKRTHYSYDPPTNLEYADDDGVIHHDVKVDIFFGSQWVSLTPNFCEFLIRQLARPDSLPSRFRDWLVDTEKLMADETFFTSMLMRFFPETIPKLTEDLFLDTTRTTNGSNVSMYAIRYERMDEHVPTSTGYYPTEQRYEVPASTGIEKPRAWGPYFLGTYDLYNIRVSGALYIRKVARAIDPNMYTILPVDRPEQIPPISWPSDVKISSVPNWKNTVAKLRKQLAGKQS
mmetsp:Transcript_4024/g.8668  ORF Transcript_4024/g.8668 Transcript_4024/m.8668 type:complete len:572 (-) Transcript_4024:2728-4443(-)